MLAEEPENAAVTTGIVAMSSEEPEEEKFIIAESNSQQQNPKPQPQSQSVASSYTIPIQHTNEDITMHATDSITEGMKRYIRSWGYKLDS